MARTRYRLALDWLKINPNTSGRLLDVGAGNGAFMAALLQHSPALDVYGVELSDAAIHLAAAPIMRRIAKCNLQVESALPWDGSFNFITCMEVLEHLPNDSLALNQIARVLDPGGRLFISVPAWRDQWGPQDVAAGHVRRYEPQDLQKLLESSGLRVTALRCWGGPFARAYLRAADAVGPQRVMSIRVTGFARFAANVIYQTLKFDDLLSSARGPQLLALAERP